MKNLIITLFTVHCSLLTVHHSEAQGCLPEGIMFTTQAQIDEFQTNYPGCTEIEGNVMFNGGIFSLNGLNVLKSIGGDLIFNTVPLTSLTGLDSLTDIAGDLEFYATDLIDLTGLGSLVSIGGNLIFGCFTSSSIQTNNPYLANLDGVGNLTTIGGYLRLYGCWSLVNVDGLANLASINGISIQENPMLVSIEGLSGIDPGTLSGIYIADNILLSNCSVESICEYLIAPGGSVDIYRNSTGCNNPTEVANGCGITLSCLPYGNYWFTTQGYVDNFQVNFPGCHNIHGSVYIIGSDITDLNGLSVISSVEGSLIMGHEWMGGGNPSLNSISGLENISSIGGTLRLQYNPLLENLSGLQNLTSINGYLQLISNDGLLNLSGLESLTHIGTGIDISANAGMVNLTGLEKVTNAVTTILIRLNDELLSLSGIDNIETGSVNDLRIYFNDKLSECDINSICQHLANPNGLIEIASNAPGCSSQEEVEAACEEGSSIIVDLDFTAIDSSAYVKLDSVRVMNRTSGGGTVIHWPDTTLSMEIVPGDQLLYIGYASRYPFGIAQREVRQEAFSLFQSYPNPVTDHGTVNLFLPWKGNVNLRVTDLCGRELFSSPLILGKGFHSFRFTPDNGNLFLITATWNGITRSIKVLSAASGSGEKCVMEYIGNEVDNLKSAPAVLKTDIITQESGILDKPESNQSITFQFATNIPCPGMPTVEYEGQVYNTIQIFSQCWLKENLNVGTMIPHNSVMSNNGMIEKYCYNDQEDSCTKYGGLYYWAEMMNYSTHQGAQGICPPGWHVPADEDWKVLEGAADSKIGIGDPEWDKEWSYRGQDAGTNLKSSTGWFGGNNGNDLFGFATLGAGSYLSYGVFDKVGQYGHLWTSTKDEPNYAKYRYLDYTSPGIYRRHSNLDYGISVRCIRDY